VSKVTNQFQAKKTTPKTGKEGKYAPFLFANKYLTNPILMTPDIFVQFLHLRVSSSVRSLLMSKPSRFFGNHISYAVLSGTLPFPGCYLVPMLQLSDSSSHSLHTLKHNIKGITVRNITKRLKYKEVNLIGSNMHTCSCRISISGQGP
jgi:hypothetical protein